MSVRHSFLQLLSLLGLLPLLTSTVYSVGEDTSYLPHCGPTPLRFQMPVVIPPAPATNAQTAAPDKPALKTEALATPTNQTLHPPIITTAASPAKPVTNSVALAAIQDAPPINPYASSNANSAGSPLSASELLVVTPQMLADFLKPNPGTPPAPGITNTATSLAAPQRLPFTPPLPQGSIGSEATYRMP